MLGTPGATGRRGVLCVGLGEQTRAADPTVVAGAEGSVRRSHSACAPVRVQVHSCAHAHVGDRPPEGRVGDTVEGVNPRPRTLPLF